MANVKSGYSVCCTVSTARRGARVVAGTAALVVFAMPLSMSLVHAQSVNAESSQPERIVEEVLVTARRREESAQDVPIAISAFDAKQIESLRIENLENLQTVVPSLSVSSASGRPNAPVYSLRGIRPTEAIYGQDPTVAVYFADFVLSPAEGSNLGNYDLASIQILKGPQGTLFGRNTTGGAILFTPRRPGDELGGNVMVGFGRYDRKEAQFGLDLPTTDKLAMRLAARWIDSDGYQTNVAPGPRYGSKLAGEDTLSARLSVVWDITDSIENYTILSWDDKDTSGRGTVLQALNPRTAVRCYDGPANPNGACFPGESLASIFDTLARAQTRDVNDVESDAPQFDSIEAWSVINTTTANLADDLTVKSIAGYRDVENITSSDMDASAVRGVLTAGPRQTYTMDHASYELQLLGNSFDDRLNWVTGLFWYREKGTALSPGEVLIGINPNNPFIQQGDVDNSSYSLFAQGTYNFTPQWSLTAGGRWTYDEREMIVSTRTPQRCSLRDPETGAVLPLSQCALKLSKDFSQPTGTLSLEFKPTADVLLYAASRLGYRSGGFNLRATQRIEYEPFDPETVVDFELGTKAEWFVGDWRMRSNFALYHQWYDDIQRTVAVQNFVGVPGSAVQNAAKAKVLGLELEQTIVPTDNLSVQISYAYTDPKYDEWVEPATGADLSQTPFHFTPKHAGSVLLSYNIPLGPTGELRFTGNASYRGDVWINSLQNIELIRATPVEVWPALRQEEYWLFDASVGWNDVLGTGLDALAYVKNIADEEYALGGVQLYPTFGLTTKAYGEPRTYGVELRYEF